MHWRFDDGHGNVSTAEQTVMVQDTTAPVPPALASIKGECSATVSAPTATDACVGPVVGATTDPLTYNAQGTFIVHWKFDDGHGNVSLAEQTVIVQDATAPVPTPLASIKGECSATVSVPTATDACVGPVVGTTTDPLSYSAQGTFTVHWRFDDGHGSVSTAEQTVVVKDTIAPTPPALVTVTGQGSASVAPPTASDNCVGPVLGITTDPLTYTTPGTFTVHWRFEDGNGNSSSANQNVLVTPAANSAPQVAWVPGVITVQYSDPIPATVITATDADSPGSTLVATFSWKTNGFGFVAGLPSGLQTSLTATAANSRKWTLTGLAALRPGAYTLRAAIKDGSNNVTFGELPITIRAEDARATYNGDVFVTTSSSSTAKVNLSATIRDSSVVPTDPMVDTSAGDIRNARVTFINRDNNTVIAANLPVTLVSSSNKQTGTAAYQWSVNLGTAASQIFTIGIIVTDYYVDDSALEDTVVTVARPLSSRSVVGAGSIVLSRPAGMVSPTVNSICEFGFAAVGGSGAPSGSARLTVRAKGHVYQIDSSSISALTVDKKKGLASGKARITDITVSNRRLTVDSNASFEVAMTDNGFFSSRDTIAIAVRTSAGALWFASNWDGLKVVEQNIVFGDVSVLSGAVSAFDAPSAAQGAEPQLSLRYSASAPGHLDILCPVQAGQGYVLQQTEDFIHWAVVKGITAEADGELRFEIDGSSPGKRFYRVLTEQ